MVRDDAVLAYQGKILTHLKEWNNLINEWQDRGIASEMVEELSAKRQVVRHKLAEMKNFAYDRWQTHKPEMDRALEDMNQTVKTVAERFYQI